MAITKCQMKVNCGRVEDVYLRSSQDIVYILLSKNIYMIVLGRVQMVLFIKS